MPFAAIKPFKHEGRDIQPGEEFADRTFRNERAMVKARLIERIGYTPSGGAHATEQVAAPSALLAQAREAAAQEAREQEARSDGRPAQPDPQPAVAGANAGGPVGPGRVPPKAAAKYVPTGGSGGAGRKGSV